MEEIEEEFSDPTNKLKILIEEIILPKLPSNIKTRLLRCIFTILLISYFCYTIYSGPILIILTTIVIQMKCFSEIINIACNVCKLENTSFRYLSWYFLIAANYYFYCQNLLEYFNVFLNENQLIFPIIKHYKFITFIFYFLGIIYFVFNLGKSSDKEQFSLLAWTHVTLLILVTQSYMIVKNIFQGLIWLILPVSIIVLNDSLAYAFGYHFGRTPLIELSPKKTWEGYMYGGISTVMLGLILADTLCQYKYFTCPIVYKRINGTVKMITSACEPSNLFQLETYPFEFDIFGLFILDGYFQIYPFIIHALWFVLFASIIAPFGGFFASGFKRAFDVKDFGNTIPGHGGIMDRFDCQYLMATFVNVYISSFINDFPLEKMFGKILYMKEDDQVDLLRLLEENLNMGYNVTINL